MSENCFVLIRYDEEMKRALVDQLKLMHNIDEIKELDDTQEILVKVIAESKDHLLEFIAMKIQKMVCVKTVQNLGTNINKNFD